MKKSPLLLLILAAAVLAQDPTRGSALYKDQCASCHGDHLQGSAGPPLAAADLATRYPAADLISKIRNTMPQNDPGKLTAAQSADLAAFIRQSNTAPAATTAAAPKTDFPPTANLQQLMRGVMFPNSNIIFTVQTHDPGEKKKPGNVGDGGFNWAQWGNDLYTGWDIVDYAALALADTAQLMLVPGRRCENGKPVPVDDPDWIRFSKELAEVGRNVYRASQTRNQEKVSDMSGDVADACLHCHQVYRDRFRGRGRGAAPGGPPASANELRCTHN